MIFGYKYLRTICIFLEDIVQTDLNGMNNLIHLDQESIRDVILRKNPTMCLQMFFLDVIFDLIFDVLR